MKWFLGVLCGFLVLNIFAQRQTIAELKDQVRQSSSVVSAPVPEANATEEVPATNSTVSTAPTPEPSATASETTPTADATPKPSNTAKKVLPKINWSGDVSSCNKADKDAEWWQFLNAYLSDSVKYAGYKVWFEYSIQYVNSNAYCFDKNFVKKVNEVASTL